MWLPSFRISANTCFKCALFLRRPNTNSTRTSISYVLLAQRRLVLSRFMATWFKEGTKLFMWLPSFRTNTSTCFKCTLFLQRANQTATQLVLPSKGKRWSSRTFLRRKNEIYVKLFPSEYLLIDDMLLGFDSVRSPARLSTMLQRRVALLLGSAARNAVCFLVTREGVSCTCTADLGHRVFWVLSQRCAMCFRRVVRQSLLGTSI